MNPDPRRWHRNPLAGRAWSVRTWWVRSWSAVVAVVLLLGFAAPAGAAQPDGQWWHTQWRMDEVWQITDGSGITVAVLDTGTEASLPELAGAVVPGADFSGAADGSDGTIDHDQGGASHGTSVASLIAGDGDGFRGVAPGARILPLVVSVNSLDLLDADRTSSLRESLPPAIRHAADVGAHVINISHIGYGQCPAEVDEAVRYAVSQDVIVVTGAGNIAGGSTGFPATCPGVLAVAANDTQLEPWEDSHRSEHVEASGPGEYVSVVTSEGRVGETSGTSYSSALVSGAVALVRAHFPEASADEVLTRVLATVADIHTPGRDDATGHGIVRPYNALTDPVPPDAPNPVFEELDDPSRVAGPFPRRVEPNMPPPSQGSGVPWALLAAGAAVLVALLAVVFLLGRRNRSDHPRHDVG